MGLTKEPIPLPGVDWLIRREDMASLSPEIFNSAEHLKKTIKVRFILLIVRTPLMSSADDRKEQQAAQRLRQRRDYRTTPQIRACARAMGGESRRMARH